MSTPRIFPSLANDPKQLPVSIQKLDPYCSGYHIDAMDGKFVRNIAWSPAAINAIELIPQNTLDTLWVHLMVENPKEWIDALTIEPLSIITFHIESDGKTLETIKQIREKKWQPSIAIKPNTNVSTVFPFLDKIDQVLIMSVEPGFSGQVFIKDAIQTLGTLVGYRQTSGLSFKIAMDGGINKTNIQNLADRGVDHFGISSGIFKEADPVQALKELTRLITKTE